MGDLVGAVVGIKLKRGEDGVLVVAKDDVTDVTVVVVVVVVEVSLHWAFKINVLSLALNES
jgi:hypothetical protein